MTTRYRQSWHLNEFTLVHVVRYRDPLNKKRFAVPFKTKEKAQAKMDQLKRDGVKEIEITQDTLRGNVKFKEGKDDAYAIGMSVAKKKMNDEPPLEKKTIEKGHEIAKSILKKEDASKDAENIAKLRTRQMALQTKLRDLDVGDPKDKTPIAITKNDIENIQMKMDQIRSKTKKEEKIHPAKALIEKITAVQNKAKKTGMPYSVLKKVYNRGMAAWKGGHRPGTTPQQWAMARVNSFVTKSSGTWGGADKDLAKQVRGSKK